MRQPHVSGLIEAALLEDLGPERQDITTESVIGDERGEAEIIANEPGIMAGSAVAEAVLKHLDPDVNWIYLVEDGERFESGSAVALINGSLRSILTGERTALNFLSHLSGIATLTGKFVAAAEGTDARIFDTRKTLPGLRFLEKAAVAAGGGQNHRFGLFDGVLIKDNHLVGQSISAAVRRVREARPDDIIEVEVDNIGQLKEALDVGADIVLLDNMDIDTLKKAIGLAKGNTGIEVSGGITLETVGAAARAGAERISIGALTQGALPIDFSLAVKAQA
jgi:nicotinate-nucleotide pyrophosphorylase (carboxylating)